MSLPKEGTTMKQYVLEDSKCFSHRIGIQVVVTMLDLWCDGNLKLAPDEVDQLEGFLHAFLEDCRDNRWRIEEGLIASVAETKRKLER